MNSVVSVTLPSTPIVDKDGRLTFPWIKWFQAVGQNINEGFDPQGNYQGPIGSHATIVGREFLATIVQHLSDAGIIDAAGLPAATPAAQGAVFMPAGATNNNLGSAAIRPATDFDPSGAAATAQANAQAFATTAANTAQSNAETFAANASNIGTGTLDTNRLGGLSAVIVTAKLTGGGTNGSMTFTNGLLTAQTPAT